jgi:hypothetical protein
MPERETKYNWVKQINVPPRQLDGFEEPCADIVHCVSYHTCNQAGRLARAIRQGVKGQALFEIAKEGTQECPAFDAAYNQAKNGFGERSKPTQQLVKELAVLKKKIQQRPRGTKSNSYESRHAATVRQILANRKRSDEAK